MRKFVLLWCILIHLQFESNYSSAASFSNLRESSQPRSNEIYTRLRRGGYTNFFRYTASSFPNTDGTNGVNVCVYELRGSSYMIQFHGALPKQEDLVKWTAENSHKYQKIPLMYDAEDNICPPRSYLNRRPHLPNQTKAKNKIRYTAKTFYYGSKVTTNLCYYELTGSSYMITIEGEVPKSVFSWLEEHGSKYQQIPLNFEEFDDSCPPSVGVKITTLRTPVTISFTKPSTTITTTTTTRRPTTTTRRPTTTMRPKPIIASESTLLKPVNEPSSAVPTRHNSLPKDCGYRQRRKGEQKITLGHRTSIENNPWQVALYNLDSFTCGGSIITNSHILTAAHCVYDARREIYMEAKLFTVKVGQTDKDITIMENIFNVHQIIGYSSFRPTESNRNDISLLVLETFLEFSTTIYPICIPGSQVEYKAQKSCIISGWGDTEKREGGSRFLREARIELVQDKVCRTCHSDNHITSGMMCAGDVHHGGKDTCQGDSGGPLVCEDGGAGKFFLYGITSWGKGCGMKHRPGVYTKVSKYRKWILDKIEKTKLEFKSVKSNGGDDDLDEDIDEIEDDEDII